MPPHSRAQTRTQVQGNECQPEDVPNLDPEEILRLTVEQLQALVQAEQSVELENRRASARARHARVPSTLPPRWTTPKIQMLRQRIESLQQGETVATPVEGTGDPPPNTPTAQTLPKSDPPNIESLLHPTAPSSESQTLPKPLNGVPPQTDVKSSTPTESPPVTAPQSSPNPNPNAVFLCPPAPSPKSAPTPPIPEPSKAAPPNLVQHVSQASDTTPDKLPPRSGPLSAQQMAILGDKHNEIQEWIALTSKEWNVSPLTITTNMGMDTRESRAACFWNKYQSVFWSNKDEKVKELAKVTRKAWEEAHATHLERHAQCVKETADIDESEKELLDDTQEALGQLREQCSQEYARLKRVERDDIDQEERDQLEHERAEIEAQYERMSNPGAAEYREGSTVTMMMQASRELTARCAWYATRGIHIARWCVSTDPVDRAASAANFTFAGSDAARAYFEEKEANMMTIMFDFETFVRMICMSDRTTKYSTNEDLYLRVKDDHNLRRRQVALRLRELWKETNRNENCKHLPWAKWPMQLIKQRFRLEGWPDDVDYPGKPRGRYQALEKQQASEQMLEALLVQNGKELCAIPWEKDLVEYANKLSQKKQHTDETFLNICLIKSHGGTVLLTVEDVLTWDESTSSDDDIDDGDGDGSLSNNDSRQPAKLPRKVHKDKKRKRAPRDGNRAMPSSDDGTRKTKAKKRAPSEPVKNKAHAVKLKRPKSSQQIDSDMDKTPLASTHKPPPPSPPLANGLIIPEGMPKGEFSLGAQTKPLLVENERYTRDTPLAQPSGPTPHSLQVQPQLQPSAHVPHAPHSIQPHAPHNLQLQHQLRAPAHGNSLGPANHPGAFGMANLNVVMQHGQGFGMALGRSQQHWPTTGTGTTDQGWGYRGGMQGGIQNQYQYPMGGDGSGGTTAPRSRPASVQGMHTPIAGQTPAVNLEGLDLTPSQLEVLEMRLRSAGVPAPLVQGMTQHPAVPVMYGGGGTMLGRNGGQLGFNNWSDEDQRVIASFGNLEGGGGTGFGYLSMIPE